MGSRTWLQTLCAFSCSSSEWIEARSASTRVRNLVSERPAKGEENNASRPRETQRRRASERTQQLRRYRLQLQSLSRTLHWGCKLLRHSQFCWQYCLALSKVIGMLTS